MSFAHFLLFLLCTFCIIFAASERSSADMERRMRNRKRVVGLRKMLRRANVPKNDSAAASSVAEILFDEYYDDDDDDGEVIIPGKEKDGSKLRYHDQDDEHKIRYGFFKRGKRFLGGGGGYQVGCLKGYRCCQLSNCRPYCSLCNDFIDVGGGGAKGSNYYGYLEQSQSPGYQDPYQGGYIGPRKCRDRNGNGVCDSLEGTVSNAGSLPQYDDEEEEEITGGGVLPQEDEDDETTGGGVLPQEDEDEEEEEDDGGLVAGEEEDPAEVIDAAAAAADDSSTTTTTTTERAQLEFTHHVYEEYMPTLPRESKPPIIIQTVPHYQISNYYSLSKHHHPHHPNPHPLHPGDPHSHPQLVKQEIHHTSDVHTVRPHLLPLPFGAHQHHQDHHQDHHHLQHNSGRDPHIFYGDVNTMTVGAAAAAAASSGPGGGGGWDTNNGLSGQLPPLPPASGYHAAPPQPPPLPLPPPTYGTTGVRSGRDFPNSVFDKLQAIAPLPGQAPIRVVDDQLTFVSGNGRGAGLVAPALPAGVSSFSPQVHYGSANPLGILGSLPLPQTIIHKPSPSDWRPPDPPQPLLKYHLIRHSYPATEEEAEYEIPAFLPGPPYLQQQSRPLAPKIRHHKRKKHHSRVKKNRNGKPNRENNGGGVLAEEDEDDDGSGSDSDSGKKRRKRRKLRRVKNGFAQLVRNIIG